ESLMKIHGLSSEPRESKEEVRPEVKVEIRAEPKPLEIHPVRDQTPGIKPQPAPPAALPVEPPALVAPEEKPGMTFPEKSHESIFRTPSEVHEIAPKNGGMKELAEAVKKDKADPYRESTE
ncbi:MAG: hypothetical protein Q8Q97_02725, partial [bacterium]|nr:hypothetical protein [bacterium]